MRNERIVQQAVLNGIVFVQGSSHSVLNFDSIPKHKVMHTSSKPFETYKEAIQHFDNIEHEFSSTLSTIENSFILVSEKQNILTVKICINEKY